MSNEISLFESGGDLAEVEELLAELQGGTEELAGNSTYRRISLKGSKFRMIEGGDEVLVSDSESLEIIIVRAAPLARSYYAGKWDPKKNAAPPICWSTDTTVPAADATEPQHNRCSDCPQNEPGSGEGDTRACKFAQQVAVVLPDAMDTVYGLKIPAMSIFGDAEKGRMPMQAYAKYMKHHNAPLSAVVTRMTFDTDASVPKLFFNAVRPLNREELLVIRDLQNDQDVIDIATFSVHTDAPAAEDVEAPERIPAREVPEKAPEKPTTKPDVASEVDMDSILADLSSELGLDGGTTEEATEEVEEAPAPVARKSAKAKKAEATEANEADDVQSIIEKELGEWA